MKNKVISLLAFSMCISNVVASPGDIDNKWGLEGRAITDLSIFKSRTEYHLSDTVVDKDERIYQVGSIKGDYMVGEYGLGVTRLLPDGTLDLKYGVAGVSVVGVPKQHYLPEGATLQPDGKLLVVGSAWHAVELAQSFLCRLDTNGNPDVTLVGRPTDEPGCTTDLGTPWLGEGRMDSTTVLAQGDGKIIVVGTSAIGPLFNKKYRLKLHRLHPNGVWDKTFGDQNLADEFKGAITVGLEQVPEYFWGVDAALDSKGRIVVAVDNGGRDFFVMQFTADGILNPSFGGAPIPGVRQIAFDVGGADWDYPQSIAIGARDSIIVAGVVQVDQSSYGVGVAKLRSNGTPDLSFGGSGLVVHHFCDVCGPMYVPDILVQNDGRVILAGTVNSDWEGEFVYNMGVMRLLPNGHKDAGFGAQGVRIFDLLDIDPTLDDSSDFGVSVVPHDGQILLGGSAYWYTEDTAHASGVQLKLSND